MLEALSSIPNLTRFDVDLTGEWALSSDRQWFWNGEAAAESKFVGIIFLKCGSQIYWAKSNIPSTQTGSQTTEEQVPAHKLASSLYLHPMVELEIQFIYSIGGGRGIYEASALLSSTEYVPSIPQSRTVQTGQLFAVATFESTPLVTAYGMYLAKQDVKTKRKHIWALRQPLLESLTSPLLEVFAFGRHGVLAI